MPTSFRKKLFLFVFCLSSITQGMYSTYFVSILTTIERIYQIQSKTAGAILSATEIGQILGSLFISYYGGLGNKPRWISVCMTISALAALISISPHFLLVSNNYHNNAVYNHQTTPTTTIDNGNELKNPINSIITTTTTTTTTTITASQSPYLTSDLSSPRLALKNATLTKFKLDLPSYEQLCHTVNYTDRHQASGLSSNGGGNTYALAGKSTNPLITAAATADSAYQQQFPVSIIITLFFTCLLAIGFGSTAITTLGIPFMDDIISKEESPLYLGLTIGLRIFGPALGFLLGSFCIRLDSNAIFSVGTGGGHGTTSGDNNNNGSMMEDFQHGSTDEIGAWWLGLVIISLPLLVLAIPMYCLSRTITSSDSEKDEYEDITYQAAEDHDIGGSHDFPAHIMRLGSACDGNGLDVTSDRTCFSSEADDISSSREVLQSTSGDRGGGCSYTNRYDNYSKNIAFQRPILSEETLLESKNKSNFMGIDHVIASAAAASDHNDDLKQHSHRSAAALANVDLRPQSIGTTTKHTTDSSSGDNSNDWRSQNVCLVVNHFGGLESTSFTNDNGEHAFDPDDCQQTSAVTPSPAAIRMPPPSSSRSSLASTICSYSTNAKDNRNNSSKNKQLVSQQQQQQQQQQDILAISSNLSSSLSRLLKNKLLLLRMLSAVLHILPIAGFYTFLPKYLIEQFRISSSSASATSGLAGILFVGFGAFIGGTIIRLFNVNSRLMTRWIASSALLYTIGMLILMNLGCTNNQTVHLTSNEFLSSDCSSSACSCSPATYSPVCANGTTYISPCLAGCKGFTITEERIIYDECGCSPLKQSYNFNSSDSNSTSHQLSHSDDSQHVNLNIATPGQCQVKCDNLIWYIILFSIFTLVHASCEVGSMMFNLRCVRNDDRTLALGLITFTSSLLGTIPCSVIYGTMVDYTCVHWDMVKNSGGPSSLGAQVSLPQESLVKGACRAYDNDEFRYYLHGLTALVMFLAFIVDIIISTRANEVDFYDGKADSRTDIRMGLKKSTESI